MEFGWIASSFLFEAAAFGVPAGAIALFAVALKNYKQRDKTDAALCLSLRRKLVISSAVLAAVAIVWTVMLILLLSELREISLKLLN